MRLFFALWPDEDTRERIRRAAEALDLNPRARRVLPQNYHATLAFIGEVPGAAVQMLRRLGAAQRGNGGDMDLDLDHIEVWEHPRVVVLAARETPPALAELARRLHQAADPIAMRSPKEPGHPLRAHVTLARKVAQASVAKASREERIAPLRWRPVSFSLVSSQTGGPQSVYTVVDTWPLLDEK